MPSVSRGGDERVPRDRAGERPDAAAAQVGEPVEARRVGGAHGQHLAELEVRDRHRERRAPLRGVLDAGEAEVEIPARRRLVERLERDLDEGGRPPELPRDEGRDLDVEAAQLRGVRGIGLDEGGAPFRVAAPAQDGRARPGRRARRRARRSRARRAPRASRGEVSEPLAHLHRPEGARRPPGVRLRAAHEEDDRRAELERPEVVARRAGQGRDVQPPACAGASCPASQRGSMTTPPTWVAATRTAATTRPSSGPEPPAIQYARRFLT